MPAPSLRSSMAKLDDGLMAVEGIEVDGAAIEAGQGQVVGEGHVGPDR